MSADDFSLLTQNALWLAVVLSLPVVGIAAVVSLFVAVFQAATQVNDMTIAHLPRFIATIVALALTADWVGSELTAFATQIFSLSS